MSTPRSNSPHIPATPCARKDSFPLLLKKNKRHLAKVHTWGELPALNVHLKFVDAVLCSNVPKTWLVRGVIQARGCSCSQCAAILAPSKASRVIGHLFRVENAVIRHDAAHDLTDQW